MGAPCGEMGWHGCRCCGEFEVSKKRSYMVENGRGGDEEYEGRFLDLFRIH